MRHIMLAAALCAATTTLASQASAQGQVRLMEFGRPRLGVSIDLRPSASEDKLGARIRDVVPDGPADKAGIKKGDIVTRFNGTALAGVASDDDDQSGPGAKLLELARKVDDGDTVKVEYRRGSETRTASIVAKVEPQFGGVWNEAPKSGNFNFRMPAMGEAPRAFSFQRGEAMPGMGGMFRMRMRGNLELIDLNADLGDYFGTKEGVLVVSSPRDSTVPLKAGDVILALDGRKPKSAEHAHRILDSYDAGETIKADVMRKQKRTTLTWTAPEMKGGMMWKMEGDSDDDMPGQPKVRIRQQGHPLHQLTPPPASERS